MPTRRGFLKAIGIGGAAVGAIAALPATATKALEVIDPPETTQEVLAPEPDTKSVIDYGKSGLPIVPRPVRDTSERPKPEYHGARTIIIANGCAVEKVDGKFRVIARHDGRLMGPKHVAAMYEGI